MYNVRNLVKNYMSRLEILHFISWITKSDSNITYYESLILKDRFPKGSEIMYNPNTQSFACRIDYDLYDFCGIVGNTGDWIPWETYKETNPSEAAKIIHSYIKVTIEN